MSEARATPITLLLQHARAGDPAAAARLLDVAYRELKALALSCLRGSAPGGTLQPTALLHEAWLKLSDPTQLSAGDREHFFALAARVMRQVLVDHARRRRTAKRGAGRERVTLSGVGGAEAPAHDVLDLDVALAELEHLDRRQAQIVEMKFFGGLETAEIAQAIGIGTATVERDWRGARAWLKTRLGAGA